ncbi:MAG: tetratricopeptide repeat protein, partial [Candidatus Hydrogenedentes bacterium]|nr:tetratricopeptide repeat protein [Candidatus Hydrogenedentota bacterium]
MRSHRIIWYITATVAAASLVILLGRNAVGPSPEALDEAATDGMIRDMLTLLKLDPEIRQRATREVVDRVATLAQSGERVSAETLFGLGLRFKGEVRYGEAEKAFQQAIDLRPDWSKPWRGLGVVLHRQQKIGDAEKAFRQAIALEPEWSRPYNDLAILLRFQYRLEEAEQEAIKAIELAPDDVAAHNNYANLLLDLGRLEDAEAEYRIAIELAPEHPKPHYNLACLASLRGDRDEALRQLA